MSLTCTFRKFFEQFLIIYALRATHQHYAEHRCTIFIDAFSLFKWTNKNKGQIWKEVKIKKQVQLDNTAINNLNKKLGDKNSYGNNHADCFEPHLGIVYYLQDKIIANVIICLDCNVLRSSIDIPAQKQGRHGQGENLYYTLDGFSKSFREYLNNLLKQYNFSHQIKANSTFYK